MEWSGFFPLMQAQIDESYSHAGLATTVTAYPDNPSLNAALLAGQIDVAALVWSDVLRLGGQGHELRVIAITDWSDHGDVILAAPGMRAPADLRGKRIACEGIHTFSHLFVLNFLAKHHLQEVDVELVNMPALEVPAALAAKAIAAGHTWGPLAEIANTSGCLSLDRAGLIPGSITQVLTVTEQTALTHAAELSKLVNCYYAKQPTTAESAEQCRTAAGKFLGKPGTDLSPIGKEAHLVNRTEALRLMRNHEDEQGLYRSGLVIVDRLARRGQIAANLDPMRFIHTACLEH